MYLNYGINMKKYLVADYIQDCIEEWHKEKREHSRKYLREYVKAKRKELRLKIIEMLGAKCCRCGFADYRALQIDHVYGKGKKDKKRFGSNYTYYKYVLGQINDGSKNYQLLCANCNWIKRYEEGEHH